MLGPLQGQWYDEPRQQVRASLRGRKKNGMGEWVPVGNDFIEADVIRWKEGVFKNKRGKSRKAVRIGERLVTAEVLKMDNQGWVNLLVRACEVVSLGWNIRELPLLPKETEIKRKCTTISRGNAERLLWSDESARASVAGEFFSKC